MKAKRIVTTGIALALLVAGAAVAFYPQLTEARYAWEQARFVQRAAAAGQQANSDGGVPMPEGAVARVRIDAIGLDAYVLEGTEPAQLDKAVGHYTGTALPGQQGNAGLAGHRTMYGHPFRRLDELKPGDEIETWTTERYATYRVVETQRVDPSRTDVIAPTQGHRITLTTCNPVGSARERLVVIGEMAQ